MIATMVGTLVQRGLLDLDRPLESYGVPRNASWNDTGTDFWPQVTARHLLSQALACLPSLRRQPSPAVACACHLLL